MKGGEQKETFADLGASSLSDPSGLWKWLSRKEDRRMHEELLIRHDMFW